MIINLHSPNLPHLQNLPKAGSQLQYLANVQSLVNVQTLASLASNWKNWKKGFSVNAQDFRKTIEYQHYLNLRASGHCSFKSPKTLCLTFYSRKCLDIVTTKRLIIVKQYCLKEYKNIFIFYIWTLQVPKLKFFLISILFQTFSNKLSISKILCWHC